MEKQLVFVVQIRVGDGEEAGVRSSFEKWLKAAEGAYAARIQADEVKVQED